MKGDAVLLLDIDTSQDLPGKARPAQQRSRISSIGGLDAVPEEAENSREKGEFNEQEGKQEPGPSDARQPGGDIEGERNNGDAYMSTSKPEAGHKERRKESRVFPRDYAGNAAPKSINQRIGDNVWRVLNSPVWGAILTAASLVIILVRPLIWLPFQGPGDKSHDVRQTSTLMAMVPLAHILNSALYHWFARARLRAPVQRSFLNKLMVCEFTAALIAGMLLLTSLTSGFGSPSSVELAGPNDTEVVTDYRMRNFMPVAGVLFMPILVLSLITLVRSRIVPKMGEQVLSPLWLRDSFVLNAVGANIGVLLVTLLLCAVAFRYVELGFGSLFSPRVFPIVEAELGAARLMLTEPRTDADIEAFADSMASSAGDRPPLRLAAAFVTAPDGSDLAWESRDWTEGLISKAYRLESSLGLFIFDLDPLMIAVSTWEAVVTVGLVLACAAMYLLARSASQSLVFSPLDTMLSALTSAAAMIDTHGAVSRRLPSSMHNVSSLAGSDEATATATAAAQQAPLHVGEAIARVIGLIHRCSQTAFGLGWSSSSEQVRAFGSAHGTHPDPASMHTARDDGEGVFRRGADRSERGDVSSAIKEAAPAAMAAEEEGEGEPPGQGSAITEGGSGGAAEAPSLGPLLQIAGSGTSKTYGMRFNPSVLNWARMPVSAPCPLEAADLLSASHLLWIKSRIPAKICKGECFVAWADEILKRHPDLPFHNPWRAISNMHAAYLALCEPDFLPLGHLRAMAVLVAALAMDACSTGKDDEDLCREGHDLAITYNFSKPQRHAAVAQVMRVARQVAGADIFADLGHSDRDKLRGYIQECIVSFSSSGIDQMRSQLIVVESRIKVLQADAATRQPQATPSPDRHSPKTLAAMAPDLAMKALAALAGLHQGWAGEDAWHTAEDRYMVQRMKGLDREDLERSERSNLLKRSQKIMKQRKDFWYRTAAPFVKALASVCPSVAGRLEVLNTTVLLWAAPARSSPKQGSSKSAEDSLSNH